MIVIDDGSSDGTEQAMHPFDERVRYFYKPNGGVSSARNEGIRRVTANLMAFLDSDDLWERNFLEVTVGYLEKHPDVAMVCTGWRTLPSGHRWPPIKRNFLSFSFHGPPEATQATVKTVRRPSCHLGPPSSCTA